MKKIGGVGELFFIGILVFNYSHVRLFKFQTEHLNWGSLVTRARRKRQSIPWIHQGLISGSHIKYCCVKLSKSPE